MLDFRGETQNEKSYSKPAVAAFGNNFSYLSHFQKILLITDGSVTSLLEHISGESIKVDKIYENLINLRTDLPTSHKALINNGMSSSPLLFRKVALQGKDTGKNWIYAESTVLVDNLYPDFRKDLLSSDLPIGKLWSKYRVETYKSDLSIQQEESDKELSSHLNIKENSEILSRTYCVYSWGKKVMIITEKFSADCFKD